MAATSQGSYIPAPLKKGPYSVSITKGAVKTARHARMVWETWAWEWLPLAKRAWPGRACRQCSRWLARASGPAPATALPRPRVAAPGRGGRPPRPVPYGPQADGPWKRTWARSNAVSVVIVAMSRDPRSDIATLLEVHGSSSSQGLQYGRPTALNFSK